MENSWKGANTQTIFTITDLDQVCKGKDNVKVT
jgi:hypothetical protein